MPGMQAGISDHENLSPMKIRETLLEHFSFNRAEQRGVVMLLIVLAGIIGIRAWVPDHQQYERIVDRELLAQVRKFGEEMSKAREQKAKMKEMRPTKYAKEFVAWGDSLKGNRQIRTPDFIIELNSADTLELQRLRGIGSAFARRIIGYRERLGGYIRKDQLMEVFGMDPERYNGIKGNLIVDTSRIRKIDINTVQFKELMRHPYFPYELTREIILHRKKIKNFEGKEQLKEIPVISDSIYMKIYPYINIII